VTFDQLGIIMKLFTYIIGGVRWRELGDKLSGQAGWTELEGHVGDPGGQPPRTFPCSCCGTRHEEEGIIAIRSRSDLDHVPEFPNWSYAHLVILSTWLNYFVGTRTLQLAKYMLYGQLCVLV
jgi:hypothetical protein